MPVNNDNTKISIHFPDFPIFYLIFGFISAIREFCHKAHLLNYMVRFSLLIDKTANQFFIPNLNVIQFHNFCLTFNLIFQLNN